jgi:hypothetical protein
MNKRLDLPLNADLNDMVKEFAGENSSDVGVWSGRLYGDACQH